MTRAFALQRQPVVLIGNYMTSVSEALAPTIAVITAMGALGTSAFGIVDASKALWGGPSRIGFGFIQKGVAPFRSALDGGSADWQITLFANWLNGIPKEDQKAATKNLIRLGLSDANSLDLAKVGNIDAQAFAAAVKKLESGEPASDQDLRLIGRFNAMVDATLDAAYERADQRYRSVSRFLAGAVATMLSMWAGLLLSGKTLPGGVAVPGAEHYLASPLFAWSVLVGLLAVPIAPIAKDLAKSLQTAATAVKAVR